MTKKSMMIAAMLGGMGVAGYMYMMTHPRARNNMRKMVRDAAKYTYEMMYDED